MDELEKEQPGDIDYEKGTVYWPYRYRPGPMFCIRESHKEYTGPILAEKKEATTMQVTYNGFTGELVKLERKEAVITSDPFGCRGAARISVYDLSICDIEKHCTHFFTGVKLEDVKFLGGEVSFR